MQKLIGAFIIFIILSVMQGQAFATTLECKFEGEAVSGIKSLRLSDEQLIINNDIEIPLSASRVKCGLLGRQIRLNGSAFGYHVILDACSLKVKLVGHLVDSAKNIAAEVTCDEI